MKCCICNNENIGQFITINNKKYHLCCIEQLKQENKQLRDNIRQMDNSIDKLQKQLIKEKDNWNNLKKIAKMHSGIKKKCYNGGLWFEIDSLLDKMQELEQGDDK